MRLYLDDNTADQMLVRLLQKVGHTVVCPTDCGLDGASDARHFEHAIRQGLVVLTFDASDFGDLHQLIVTAGGSHPGVLILRRDNNPKRDMDPKQIISAMGKLQRATISLLTQCIVLNHWR